MDEEPNKYGFLPSVWAAMAKEERRRHSKNWGARNRYPTRTKAQKQRMRQLQKEFRERNRERLLPYWKARRDAAKLVEGAREKERAYQRDYYWKTIEKQRARNKRRYAKERSIKKITLSPDEVFKLINKAVSRAIPKFVRDDVIAEMCLAVLEGKLFIENIGKEASKFLAAHNRAFDHFKTISVDTKISEGVTILDTLTQESLGYV
ncbi:hypothetical protein [Shinella sp. JR1-6]|uniref:hypothetical protein n=1 Tax=Shinella sp. JR1-6 TaxID=2527671 RepID=UPI00102D4C4D|nr:hypothetical protein [Shinella sp. JR1-6]TAA54612.1 hypothetical protein EXZ48_26670 [Shinella sp. JR1-6]